MKCKMQISSQVNKDHHDHSHEPLSHDEVLKFKKRMLEWPNPVEYVNNMYGCHPGNEDNEYFKVIFSK